MRSLLPTLALLALTPFLHAGLEENLPATTYGLAKIESVPATRKNLETNPFALALKGDRIKEFLKPLTDRLKDGEDAAKFAEFEKHRDELLAALSGEVVFAVVRTPDPVAEHLPYDYVLLADTTLDQAGITELLKKLGLHQPDAAKDDALSGEKAKKSEVKTEADEDDATPLSATGAKPKIVAPELIAADEDYRGLTLHTLRVKVDDKPVTVAGWALVEKTFVYTTAPNVLRELVDARRDGRKDNFTGQAVYKTNKDAFDGADAWALINMPLVAGRLREMAVEKAAAKKSMLSGVDIVKAYDALALDAFGAFRVSATLKSDDTRMDSSISWTEKRGLVKLLVDPIPKDAAPNLAVIPSGVMNASAVRFDVSVFFARFESLLREAFPAFAPMIDMQLDKVKKQQGADVRAAILENFGDEVWSFCSPAPATSESGAPAAADTVFVLTLKDENKLNSFIETLVGKVAAAQTGDGVKSLFDERELLGVKIRTIKGTPRGTRVSYAITAGRLFVATGEGKLLDRTLAQFADPKGGLADNPTFKAGLAKLPKGGDSVSYIDVGEYFSFMGKTFATIVNMKLFATGDGNAGDGKVDPYKAPVAADLPFVAVGNSSVGDNEITSRTVVLRKPDANR